MNWVPHSRTLQRWWVKECKPRPANSQRQKSLFQAAAQLQYGRTLTHLSCTSSPQWGDLVQRVELVTGVSVFSGLNTLLDSSRLLKREITSSMFYFLDSSNSECGQKWRDMPDYESPLSHGAKPVKGLLSVRFLHCTHNPSLTFSFFLFFFLMMVLA